MTGCPLYQDPGERKNLLLYNLHFAGQFAHISLNELHIRNRESRALQDCAENDLNFVVDNTNPACAERNRYIQFDLEEKLATNLQSYCKLVASWL